MARATVLQTSAETPRPTPAVFASDLSDSVSRLPLAVASSPPALLPRLSFSYVRLLLTKPLVLDMDCRGPKMLTLARRGRPTEREKKG